MKAWDLRKNAVVLTMAGHADTITGMRISPDGSHLLTNAMVRCRADHARYERVHPTALQMFALAALEVVIFLEYRCSQLIRLPAFCH